MEKRIRRFKLMLQSQMPRRGPGKRFPASLVTEAVSIATEAQASGWSHAELARELGVGVGTLERWCERERQSETYPATMQPVALLPAGWGEERPQVVVHGPASLRVEGLGIEDLVVLVSFR